MRRTKQKGSINRIGDWWVLRYYERCLKDGKLVTMRRAKRLGLTAQYKTRKSAELLAEDVLRPVNEHSYEPETVTKLGEFVERVYLPYAREHLKPSTVRGYIDNWNNHLAARCAEWWLRDVRTCDIQHVLDTLARENVIRRNDQTEVMLAERSLKNIKSLLSGIFKHAKQQGYFDGENPVRDSAAKSKAAPGEERLPYSLDEVRGMIRVLPEPAMTVVTVAAFTGLRRGELQGLLWENYNGEQLSVTRSIWNGKPGAPKTKKSRAPVPVIPLLRHVLDAYRANCGNPETGPMFPNRKGGPRDPNNLLGRVILPTLNRCALCKRSQYRHDGADHEFKRDASRPRWHGWHGFRYGLATNLNELGVPATTIQAILRHANVATTNLYIKTIPAHVAAAMEKLENFLSGSNFLLDSNWTQKSTGDGAAASAPIVN